MADVRILKAVEFSKLSAKFKKQYANEQALFAAGWWLQPKFDGCYAEFHIDNRGVPTARANTRTDEPIRSCQHIIDELVAITPKGSQCVYVGELWTHAADMRFPQISGEVRRHSPSTDLQFMAFDLLPPGLETTEPYKLRYTRLAELLDIWNSQIIYLAPTINRNVLDPVVAAAKLKATGKYDGAILRDPNAGYKIGLVKNGEIVKVKPVISLDLLVTDVFTEPGAKTGRPVYSIEVVYRGVKSKVGSGVPHSRDDVPNIGQIAEVECMDITADGKLREPRFKGIRFDKESPDV